GQEVQDHHAAVGYGRHMLAARGKHGPAGLKAAELGRTFHVEHAVDFAARVAVPDAVAGKQHRVNAEAAYRISFGHARKTRSTGFACAQPAFGAAGIAQGSQLAHDVATGWKRGVQAFAGRTRIRKVESFKV